MDSITIHISSTNSIDVLITEAAQFEQELMKSDQITLSWSSDENTAIPVGAYIEYKGEKYTLLDPYTPTQKDEVEWSYTPVFKSEIMRWSKVPFFFYTYSSDDTITGRETDWVLTDTPANFMSKVCESIKNETGATWTYSVDASLAASITITFSSVDIFSALNSIANAFETEWWVDKTSKVLHLSKAAHGDAVTLEVDVNIGVPTVQSQNGKEYYNRFYAFGSTRNIPQDYSGANVNNLTNKRLTLDPAVYPGGYKDTVEGLTPQTALSKILVFDEIYPHSDLEISDVRARLRYVLDENGNKVQVGTDDDGNPVYDQYAIWYFKISGFTFNNTTYDEESNPNGMLLPGLTLSVHFRSGALTGREFELAYHDAEEVKNDSADVTPFTVEAGDYEILYIKEGSYIIPAQTGIVPADGDDVTLFNIKMPDSYNATAYDELEDALNEAIEEYTSDLNSYTSKSNPVAFNTSDPGLVVGRNVTYKNGSYTLSTRVTKIVKKLDYEVEQTITFGNSVIKGSTQELKEDVVLANRNIDILTQLNQLSNQLTQSYVRAQQSMIEGFARIGNMWKFDPDDPDNTIYTPFNVYSEKAVSAGGKGTGGDVPAGVTKLSALEDVSLADLSVGQVLKYDGEKWVNANAAGGISSLTINLGTVSYKGVGTTDVVVNLPAYPTTLPASDVYAWAKQPTKPSYTAAEVGALTQAAGDGRYALTTGTNATGTWPISITGNSATSTKLALQDTRSVNTAPFANGAGLIYHLKYNTADGLNDGGVYHSVLQFNQWKESSGGLCKQLALTDGGNMWFRNASSATAWGAWKKLLDSSNYAATLDTRYVKKSGDTMTGALTVNTGTGARLVLDHNISIWANSSGGWSRGFYVRDSSGSSFTNNALCGASGNGNTLAYLYYGGTYDSPAISILPSNKYVGIGTNAPAMKLHVVGDARFDGWIYSDNQHGWYNFTYGGGIYMKDSTWVRVYNAKGFWVGNDIYTTTKVIAVGGYQVGPTPGVRVSYVQTYLSLESAGNEMCIGGAAADGIYINYRKPSGGYAPAQFLWKAGSSSSWADFALGSITANGNVTATGQVSAGNASDRRLKSDITTLTEGETAHVLSYLNPVSFTWNAKAEELSGGDKKGIARSFVADEFLSLLPNAGRKMWNDYDAIYTEQVVPYLTKGWQMHERRLSNHERRIQELEKENMELKRQLRRVA